MWGMGNRKGNVRGKQCTLHIGLSDDGKSYKPKGGRTGRRIDILTIVRPYVYPPRIHQTLTLDAMAVA